MKRLLVAAALALCSFFLVSWALLWLLAGSQVPRDTRVLGLEIGARSRTDAAVLLERRFSAEAVKPIAFETVGQLHKVNPRDLGATIDFLATVSSAGSRGLCGNLVFGPLR